MAERVELHLGKSDEERDHNVKEMAAGVAHFSCLLVAKLQASDSPFSELLRDGEHFSSVEVYENGAMNLFIRDPYNMLVAFVRVRPA